VGWAAGRNCDIFSGRCKKKSKSEPDSIRIDLGASQVHLHLRSLSKKTHG
jgi:hypothetical protein